MIKKEAMEKAAEMIRELAGENEKLKVSGEKFKDYIKIAFELANNGKINDSYSAIMKKAEEFATGADDVNIALRALEYNSNEYTSPGELQKVASSTGSSSNVKVAEMEALRILEEGL